MDEFSDRVTTIEELKEMTESFCKSLDWNKFNNPRNVASSLSVEANELLEIFLWRDEKELDSFFDDPVKREKIEHELADVMFAVLTFSYMYNIDLSETFRKKMEHNRKKYPADKFKGSARKYNEDK
ncbi:MAG TPA: nucleotide pyrophosphohydrolase [Alphaproteobacteria bacterium]|nr:nucleotide pyrophosphohydrolase [Alphaproteobacteria bacterium]